MTDVSVDQIVREYELATIDDVDEPLRDIRAAILLEDVFDVVLADDQISGLHRLDKASLTSMLSKIIRVD